MSTELGLRYKRTKPVNNRANKPQALVQRQRFALQLIELMMSGQRIINIDESSVG